MCDDLFGGKGALAVRPRSKDELGIRLPGSENDRWFDTACVGDATELAQALPMAGVRVEDADAVTLETACFLLEPFMNADIPDHEHAHLAGEGVMHLIAPRWPRHAALFVLAHRSAPRPHPCRARRGQRPGSFALSMGALLAHGAAALTLAWHAHRGTLRRIQLRFPG